MVIVEMRRPQLSFRQTTADFLDRPSIRKVLLAVIIANAILLGLETSQPIMAQAGRLIGALDAICLAIFTLEIGTKIFAQRAQFIRSGWNIFDFIIVGVAFIPGAQGFSVLRALRILRVLRVISVAPSLRRVVEGFITALPGMGSVFLLMGLLFYIGAVMTTKLFGAAFPDWFGTLGRSGYSLFQIMTLESWSMGIVRPVMEVYPYAWVFFLPFILVTTFAVVNLLVGLIVNSMQDAHHQEDAEAAGAHRDELMAKLDAIEARLDALK